MSGPDGRDLQYDLTSRERRLVEDRARLRASLRAQYVKNVHSPYGYLTRGDGGYVFDASLQRWMSMQAQHYHYFKPTAKTAAVPIFIISFVLGFGELMRRQRAGKEAKLRTGQISYRDRDWKFI